jgi:hypothetical protein
MTVWLVTTGVVAQPARANETAAITLIFFNIGRLPIECCPV